ncbi:MAG: hypothetical protein H0U70_13140 [Tatlockia sp.]|nr:hypothetical protein [Tatlockia sp.]
MLTRSETNETLILKCEETIKSYQDFVDCLDFMEKFPDITYVKLDLQMDENLLAEAMSRFTSLIYFKLNNLLTLQLFNFSNFCFCLITFKIRIHPTLEHFTFQMNENMNSVSARHFADLLNSNSKLTSIAIESLAPREFCDCISFSAIFKSLENNTSLSHLDLGIHSIMNSKQTANDVAAMLKINRSLKSLKLSNIFFATLKQDIKTIFAALAENQTVVSLTLETNNSINHEVINLLEKNTSLIYLHLYPIKNMQVMGFRALLTPNNITPEISRKFEHIINRNINFKICTIYQKYLLLFNLFPKDLVNLIFSSMLVKIGREEIIQLAKTPSYKNRDYLIPPIVEELIDNKINHFKTIYKALYESQSSFFKHWNDLVDTENLSAEAIEQAIEANPNKDSRTAKAWKLAKNYSFEPDYQKLFRKVHQYSHAHSSNCFGLFKQSHNFPHRHLYKNFELQMKQAKQGSRTKIIADIFEASSIRI